MSEPNNPWKTLSSHIIHQNRWHTIYEDEVITPSGKPGTYTYIESPPFVIIVAYDGERFVMVRQYRYPSEEVTTEFPGGGIDSEEDPLAAAKRELMEESGITAQKWTKIGTIHNPNFGTIFLAEDLTDTGFSKMNEDGITNTIRVTLAEINLMITNEELTDSKTLAALLFFERHHTKT